MQTGMESELGQVQENYHKLQERIKLFSEQFSEKIVLEEKEYEKEIQKYTELLEQEFVKQKRETQKILLESQTLQADNKKFWKEDMERQQKVESLVVENTRLLEKKIKLSLSLLKMQEQLVEKEHVI